MRLISHVDGEEKFSAEGYWGNPGFAAIESESQVPSWIVRNDIGTSIFAVGFREQENWVDRMTLALATNFFFAIDRQEIEFSLNGGSVNINQASLDGILASEKLKQTAEDNDELLEFERAKRLIQCLHSDATQKHTISVPNLGDFTLHLLIAADLPREVHVIRNGIYICDNFAKFGQQMKRFPGTQEFIAVLEPARTEAGNIPSQLLKLLENPAHNAFEPERIVDAAERQKAKSQIKTLINSVREIIKSAAKIADVDRSKLEELSHLFAAGSTGATANDENAEKDPERFKYSAARKNQRNQPPATGGKGTVNRRGGPFPRTKKGVRTRNKPNKPAGAGLAVPLENVRSVISDKNSTHVRTIFFTPMKDANVEISVAASGLTDDVDLFVSGASEGTVVHGKIQTLVVGGQRASIEVTFSEPFAGPIELSASTVAKKTVQEGA